MVIGHVSRHTIHFFIILFIFGPIFFILWWSRLHVSVTVMHQVLILDTGQGRPSPCQQGTAPRQRQADMTEVLVLMFLWKLLEKYSKQSESGSLSGEELSLDDIIVYDHWQHTFKWDILN